MFVHYFPTLDTAPAGTSPGIAKSARTFSCQALQRGALEAEYGARREANTIFGLSFIPALSDAALQQAGAEIHNVSNLVFVVNNPEYSNPVRVQQATQILQQFLTGIPLREAMKSVGW